jgi:thioredoxin-like negative regulator of GroEL
MPNNVSMIIVDIDKGKDIASALKVRSVPTMYNFINGAPMDSVVGASSDHITSFFRKTLARASS